MEVDNVSLKEITSSTIYTNKVLISVLNRSGNTDTVKIVNTNDATEFITLADGQSVTLQAKDGYVLPSFTILAGNITFRAGIVTQ